MYTRPSIVDLLNAVMASLTHDIAGNLEGNHAKTCLSMAQVLLQCAIQRVQSELPQLLTEHNEMVALYREVADTLGDSTAAAAARVRKRGEQLGSRSDLSLPFSQEEVAEAHHMLSNELISTLDDLDELIRTGDTRATAALQVVRAHLAKRSQREFQTLMVNPGSLAGRG